MRRLSRRLRGAASGDDGSILPLTCGYAVLALVTALVCADATSLYIAQKRLEGLADAASLAAADSFTLTLADDGVHLVLSPEDVRSQAEAFVAAVAPTARVISATTPDGASARVGVSDAWHPPVLSLFVPEGLPLRATATSRTAVQ